MRAFFCQIKPGKGVGFLGALLWLATSALASERISDYHSDITLRADGQVEVTETLRVNVEHRGIRHGIYRDFPTRYKDNHGLTNNIVGFRVEDVLLDGRPVPYRVESLSNGKRIRIGSASSLVPRGQHEYTIRYTTNRQMAFAGGLARFWWNVTGSDWRFPIDHAKAVIHTPPGAAAEAVEQNAWLGPPGATDSSGVALSRPDSSTLVWFPWFYYRAWDKVGRDPPKGAVMARFKPPRDLSPAAVRYIWKEGADNKTFTSALLDLAVKGYLKLRKLGRKSYQLTKTARAKPWPNT